MAEQRATLKSTNLRLDALELLFRRFLFWGLLIGCGFLIGIGVFALAVGRTASKASTAATEAKDATEQIVAQRTESRQQICAKDKKFAEAHNRLVMVLATGNGTHVVRPEDEQALKENTVNVPDCSPAGIKAFYEGQK